MSNHEEQPTTEEQPIAEAQAVPKGLKPEQVIAISSLISQILLDSDNLDFLLDQPRLTLRRAGIPDDEVQQVTEFLYQLEQRIEAKLEGGTSHWQHAG